MGKARYSILSDRARKPLIKLERKPSYLNVLDFLQDYDVLPASYLKAAFASPWYVKNLLTPLAKAHLIKVPDGYEHNNARGRVRPLQITELGEAFLADRLRHRFKHNDDFKHKYLRSIVKFSFDRAPIEIPHLVLRTEADIKAHPNTPEDTRNDQFFSNIPLRDYTICPDAPLFGFQYVNPSGGTAHMYFHEEVDRATEPGRSSDAARKSIRGMIRHYRQYIESGMYHSRYGLSRVTVLIVTIGEARMNTILDIIKEEIRDDIAEWFAVKVLPNVLKDDPLPPPTAHMVTEPWFAVDGPFTILETLKQIAEGR